MAWPVYKPPSGIPAGGQIHTGWTPRPAEPWTKDNQPDRERKKAGHMKAEEYKQELLKKLGKVFEAYDAALQSPNDNVRLNAALAVERRLYGDVKQTVEVQNDTRSEAEIMASIAEKRRLAGLE